MIRHHSENVTLHEVPIFGAAFINGINGTKFKGECRHCSWLSEEKWSPAYAEAAVESHLRDCTKKPRKEAKKVYG